MPGLPSWKGSSAEQTSVSHEKVVEDEYYLLQAYPIFDAECKITGALEISRIITKEKNMERQLLQADKLASLGQLVSGIGHEINNPNTFIRGNLFIVQEAMRDIFRSSTNTTGRTRTSRSHVSITIFSGRISRSSSMTWSRAQTG